MFCHDVARLCVPQPCVGVGEGVSAPKAVRANGSNLCVRFCVFVITTLVCATRAACRVVGTVIARLKTEDAKDRAVLDRVCARLFRNLAFYVEGRLRCVEEGVTTVLGSLVTSPTDEVRGACSVFCVSCRSRAVKGWYSVFLWQRCGGGGLLSS